MKTQQEFEEDVKSGDFYAVKLNELIAAFEHLNISTQFSDGSSNNNANKHWANYHIKRLKRLKNNFELNWSLNTDVLI